jgi:hypothetical protein
MVRDPVRQILLSVLLLTLKYFALQVLGVYDEVAAVLEVRSRQKLCCRCCWHAVSDPSFLYCRFIVMINLRNPEPAAVLPGRCPVSLHFFLSG